MNNKINKNELEIDLDALEIDTDAADLSTTESTVEEENSENEMLSNFGDVEDEMDLTTEKINELNKKLPAWSLEPPHKFIK